MRSFDITGFQTAPGNRNFADDTLFSGLVSNFTLPCWSGSYGLIYCKEGSVKLNLNGVRHELGPERFLIVNKSSELSISIGKVATRPALLFFRSQTTTSLSEAEESWTLVERFYPATEAFRQRINLLMALPDSCSSFISMQCGSVIRSILREIKSVNEAAIRDSLRLAVRKKSTREDAYKKIAIARDYIENNYCNTITLAGLSSMVAMNHQHFLRLFAETFQKTPRQYLIDVRIEAAKRLLCDNNRSIAEICQSVGWESVNTFNNLFKQKTGNTPGVYRKLTTPPSSKN